MQPAGSCDAALTWGEMVEKDKIEIDVFFFLGQSGEGQAVQPAEMGVGVSDRLKVCNWAGDVKCKGNVITI